MRMAIGLLLDPATSIARTSVLATAGVAMTKRNTSGSKMSFSSTRLVEARRRLGLTQLQLAEAANVSHSALQLYETGKSQPKPINLRDLAQTLGGGNAGSFRAVAS